MGKAASQGNCLNPKIAILIAGTSKVRLMEGSTLKFLIFVKKYIYLIPTQSRKLLTSLKGDENKHFNSCFSP